MQAQGADSVYRVIWRNITTSVARQSGLPATRGRTNNRSPKCWRLLPAGAPHALRQLKPLRVPGTEPWQGPRPRYGRSSHATGHRPKWLAVWERGDRHRLSCSEASGDYGTSCVSKIIRLVFKRMVAILATAATYVISRVITFELVGPLHSVLSNVNHFMG